MTFGECLILIGFGGLILGIFLLIYVVYIVRTDRVLRKRKNW